MFDQNQMSVDIETLAKVPKAVVVSLGVCVFSPDGLKVFSEKHLLRMDSQVVQGRVIDPDTVGFWVRQSGAARLSSFPENDRPLRSTPGYVLTRLNSMWKEHKCSCAWGLGAIFDLGILEDLGRDYGVDVPWSHRQQGCLRTLGNLYPEIPRPKPEIAHDPEHDAIAQALWAVRLLGETRGVAQ